MEKAMETYFNRENKEIRALILECMVELDDSVKVDYLTSVLSAEHNQTRTIKETFERELKMKKKFEKDMEEQQCMK